MKVKEFIEESNKVSNSSIKADRIKSMLKVKPYVSFAGKVAVAERAVKVGTMTPPDENGVPGEFKLNSPIKYLIHVLGLIEAYTDLEVDYEDVVSEYDLLNSNGYIEEIVQLIGEKEIAECQMCLDFVYSDAIQNHFTPHAFIQSQVERFGTLAGVTLSPILESLANTLENLDDDKIEKIAKLIGKFAK